MTQLELMLKAHMLFMGVSLTIGATIFWTIVALLERKENEKDYLL